MSKTYKVFSIDFDYFVDATRTEKFEFPDPNENLPVSLNTALWVTHYGNWRFNVERYGRNHDRLLTEVGVNEAYKQVMGYLKKVLKNAETKVVIVNSHASIFSHLKSAVKNNASIKLCNLDDHSDFYGIGSELNCGNWGNLLYELVEEHHLETASEVVWIGHPDSAYNSDEDSVYQHYVNFLKKEDVSQDLIMSYLEEYFKGIPDLIFLCRSSCWTPPHLDYKFGDMAKVLCGHANSESVIEQEILVPRYNSGFKQSVEEYYNVISQMKI